MPKDSGVRPGDKYNNWLILYKSTEKSGQWVCECQGGYCSPKTITTMKSNHLTSGQSKACHTCAAVDHGHCVGGKRTPEREAWKAMKSRCYNPKDEAYPYYGAIGVYVCERYKKNYIEFYNDIGPKPTLEHTVDRIDNNGNYTCEKCPQCIERNQPMNICWATMAEQNRHKGDTNLIWYKGEEKCLIDWARIYKMNPKTLYDRRYKQQLSIEEALTLPLWYDRRNKDTKDIKATKETKHQAAFDALLKKKQEEQK